MEEPSCKQGLVHTRTSQSGKDVAGEVMVEACKVKHGPKKADRDWLCCLFPAQKLGLIQSM